MLLLSPVPIASPQPSTLHSIVIAARSRHSIYVVLGSSALCEAALLRSIGVTAVLFCAISAPGNAHQPGLVVWRLLNPSFLEIRFVAGGIFLAHGS